MKQDKRIKQTREALQTSLIELMEERSLRQISVKDICDRADINRSTFYVHFGSQYELLDSLKNELYDELYEKSTHVDDLKTFIRQMCETMAAHKKLMVSLLKTDDSIEYGLRLSEMWRSVMHLDYRKLNISELELETTYNYVFFGSFSLIYMWLLDTWQFSLDEISERLYRLVEKSFKDIGKEEQ